MGAAAGRFAAVLLLPLLSSFAVTGASVITSPQPSHMPIIKTSKNRMAGSVSVHFRASTEDKVSLLNPADCLITKRAWTRMP